MRRAIRKVIRDFIIWPIVCVFAVAVGLMLGLGSRLEQACVSALNWLDKAFPYDGGEE